MKYALTGVLIVAVLGLGYYWYSRTASPAPAAGDTTGQESAQSSTFTGSFKDLLTRGGDWRCTLESTVGGAASSGTTYTSGGMVRADVEMSVEGYGTMESHMIADGTNVYTWSPMMPFGVKASMTDSPVATPDTSGGESFDAAGAYSYHCEPWSADRSMFELPSGVTFRTIDM